MSDPKKALLSSIAKEQKLKKVKTIDKTKLEFSPDSNQSKVDIELPKFASVQENPINHEPIKLPAFSPENSPKFNGLDLENFSNTALNSQEKTQNTLQISSSKISINPETIKKKIPICPPLPKLSRKSENNTMEPLKPIIREDGGKPLKPTTSTVVKERQYNTRPRKSISIIGYDGCESTDPNWTFPQILPKPKVYAHYAPKVKTFKSCI